MAKAATWPKTDAEARKRGEQTGLDTLVVHALNDAYSMYGRSRSCVQAKAISKPPGEYVGNDETQRN